jgi:hypothetical protein
MVAAYRRVTSSRPPDAGRQNDHGRRRRCRAAAPLAMLPDRGARRLAPPLPGTIECRRNAVREEPGHSTAAPRVGAGEGEQER